MTAHQYEADGVFQGGGVKGIALVGALAEFERQGYTRWVKVAGTSAVWARPRLGLTAFSGVRG